MVWLIPLVTDQRRRTVVLVGLLVLASCGARQAPAVPGEETAPLATVDGVVVAPDAAPLPVAAFPQAARARPAVPRQTASAQPPLDPLVLTQIEDEPRVTELDTARLSLLMAEPISITDLLFLLVRDTAVSIVPDPSIIGTFVGELKNVTVRQALDLALAPLDLEYAVTGGVVRVFPRRTVTRVFEVDYVTTRRSTTGTLTASPSSPFGEVPPSAVTVRRTDDEDLFAQLSEGVRALLSPRGRLHLDRKAALVQVTDYADRLLAVDAYLDRVRVRALRQVHLLARIIEVELDAASAGVDWPAALATAGGRALSNARASITPAGALDDLDALVSALGAQGRVTVVSSPSIVTLSNEPTVVSVSTSHPTHGGGLTLIVTAHVGAEGMLTLSVSPSVASAGGGRARPREDAGWRLGEVDTVARVRDGETLVLAGLSFATVHPPPAAEVGPLEPEPSPTRTDLIILLTPTVMANF